MVLKSSYYMIRRMLRGYLGLAILVVLPIVVISVIGLVARDHFDETLGLPGMDVIALINILAFQLFGGNYTLEFLREDLFSAKKWRMYSLPYPVHLHAISILISSALFSALQGFVIVLFTHWVYNVNWGNLWLVLGLLLLFSTFTQMVYLLIALGIKSEKLGERLGEIYGLGSIALAGVWFSMPDIGIFNFLTMYGNPLSLARNVMLHVMTGRFQYEAILSLGILVVASVVMLAASAFLGRRRLA